MIQLFWNAIMEVNTEDKQSHRLKTTWNMKTQKNVKIPIYTTIPRKVKSPEIQYVI